MPTGNRVEGLDSLERKLERLLETSRVRGAAANQKNAQEFHDKVATIVPHTGDGRGGDLSATLKMEPGENEGSWQVTIGGPQAPYPAHLEWGHMAPNGEKVAAVPFWYPARRVLRPRTSRRAKRAMNLAIKDAKGVT